MKFRRFGRSAAVLSIAALALTACGGNGEEDTTNEGGASGELIGGGASSQEAAMTAWTQGINESNPDLTVNYDPVGSGAGREGFINGAYSFAGSDAAMDTDEQSQADAVCGPDGVFHVPSYTSPVAVSYNLPDFEGENVNMDADTIAAVFAGEITEWNDPQIQEQNDEELPETPITVVHRSDDSGTTENFTAYLDEAAGESWSYGEVETWPSEITAESAQQTSGVVGLTSDTEGAITYADASQIGDLGTVAVGVGEDYVPYSAEAAAEAVASSEEDSEAEGAVVLDRSTESEGVYPIVLVSYHIFCHTYQDQDTADQAMAFGNYVISEEGQEAAAESAGSAPVSESIRESATERLDGITAEG